jgi:hypothetical protein
MFRAKRQLLDMLQEQALDDDEALELQTRVAAMDAVIDKYSARTTLVHGANRCLGSCMSCKPSWLKVQGSRVRSTC